MYKLNKKIIHHEWEEMLKIGRTITHIHTYTHVYLKNNDSS